MVSGTDAQPYWSIVSGGAYCEVTSNGDCITDGIGSYNNPLGSYGINEACTMRA